MTHRATTTSLPVVYFISLEESECGIIAEGDYFEIDAARRKRLVWFQRFRQASGYSHHTSGKWPSARSHYLTSLLLNSRQENRSLSRNDDFISGWSAAIGR